MAQMRVRVVGAGIVGLTSALRLTEAGHRVEVVAADLPEATTSWTAAALWLPYPVTPPAAVLDWMHPPFTDLAGMAGDPGTGVRFLPGLELLTEPLADPWWRSSVPDLSRVTGEQLPTGYRDGYRLTVPVIDMAVHLDWLLARLRAAGVGIEVRRLADLSAALAGVDAAGNGSGLAARQLAGDRELRPVRGQIVVVEQFGLTEWLLDHDDPLRLTYLVPREDTVILGGTAEEDDADPEARPATAEAILARCAALVPRAAGARILGHRVGLRPDRPTVRLDTERRAEGPVVHCYGHGGSGVMLAYGCAREVVRQIGLLS